MDPITIASLVSMIAGTAMQIRAAQAARARQQQAIQAAMQRQQQFQQQAENTVMQRVEDYAPEQRQQQQQAIEDQLAHTLNPSPAQAPAPSAQAVPSEAAAAQGQVSQDYLIARARAQANALQSAEQLARLLGKTTSAQRLRQQEGFGLANTAQSLGQIGNAAQGMRDADSLAIGQAGIPNGWMTTGGQALQQAGQVGLMRGSGGDVQSAAVASSPTQMPATLGGPRGNVNMYAWHQALRGAR